MTAKIFTVIGGRPQFIKAAITSKSLKEHGFNERYIDTGQHYDYSMQKIFYEELQMQEPVHFLNVGSASHGVQTGRMMEKLDSIFLADKPDLVIVYGDTNSTLAGALCAKKLNIPLVHIEGGVRSFDMHMPEEINRICTDHCADLLFVVMDAARKNLLNEGISQEKITVCGDVMLDACMHFCEEKSTQESLLSGLDLSSPYIVVTIHRPANTDNPERFCRIMDALENLAENTQVIFPVHPRTRKLLDNFKGRWNKLNYLEPLGYLAMIKLLKNASLAVTDSGGVQREACFLNIPSIVLRDQTEWLSLVERNASRLLVPQNSEQLTTVVQEMMDVKVDCAQFADVFGSGDAAEKIVVKIKNFL